MWRYPTYFYSLYVQKTLAVIDVTLSQPSEERSVMRLLCLEWTQTQEELRAFTEQWIETYGQRRIIAREELWLLCKAQCYMVLLSQSAGRDDAAGKEDFSLNIPAKTN